MKEGLQGICWGAFYRVPPRDFLHSIAWTGPILTAIYKGVWVGRQREEELGLALGLP